MSAKVAVVRGCLLIGLLALGCSRKPIAPLAPLPRLTLPRSADPGPAAGSMPTLDLGALGAGAHGPYLASHDDHGLVLVVAPGAGGKLVWSARPLDASGEAAGEAKDLGAAPSAVTLLSLRAGPDGGFLVLWARKVEGGHAIEVLALDAAGAPRGKVSSVYQAAEPPLWADVVATASGAHVYFTLASGSLGRVHAVELGAGGEVKSPTAVALEGAMAWHAVGAGRGSVLLAVVAREPGAQLGQAVAVPIGEGARVGAAEVLQKEPVVEPDIDAVSAGDRVVAGWSERGPFDVRVKLAALGPDGKAAARGSLQSAGDQGLVGLTRGHEGGVLVVWDDPALRPGEGRMLRVSALPPDLGAASAEGTLRYGLLDGSVPVVQPAPWGHAALTLTKACKADADCAKAPLLPTFVKLGPDLSPLGQAPLLLPSGSPPESSWALQCSKQGCAALALDSAATPSAHVVRLTAPGDDGWRPAVTRLGSEGSPAVTAFDTLWRGPRVADVSMAPVGDGWLAVSVTDHSEGSAPPPLPADADRRGEAEKDRAHERDPRRMAARSALVTVHPLGKEGSPSSPARTLSARALSSPGVAIAPDASGKEACVAWVARDNGDPEVFLTRVGRDGKRLGQQALTRAKGDVLDVAVAPVEDGWIVAWVDTRDGNGEVYAARVNAELKRRGPEQRVTSAPGDASDLALLVRGKTAIVAFSDSRGSPKDGVGDVYVARLRTDDAARSGDEVRVAATPEHGRALLLQPLGSETLLAWLEQPGPTTDAAARTAQVHLTLLDASGALRSLPDALPLPIAGPLTSLAASCQGDACRFVTAHPRDHGLQLAAFSWQRGQREAKARDLGALFAGAGADVTPALGPGFVLVGDDGPPGEGRLRRVGLRWAAAP